MCSPRPLSSRALVLSLRTAEPVVLGRDPLVWLEHRRSQIFKEPLASGRGSHASHGGRGQICHHPWGTASPNANPPWGIFLLVLGLPLPACEGQTLDLQLCHWEASSSPVEEEQLCDEEPVTELTLAGGHLRLPRNPSDGGGGHEGCRSQGKPSTASRSCGR